MAKATITLTEEQLAQVSGLKADEAEYEKQLADIQQKLTSVRDILKAVAVLSAQSVPAKPAAETLFPPPHANGAAESKNDLTAAVERLANTATAPLSKKKLKAHLIREGYPAKRLGNYFYTVLRRLHDHDRIMVYDNGTVWKAQSK